MSYATDRMAETRWLGHGNDWPEGQRPCMKCELMKPIKDFHKHRACKGGYNSVCKVCRVPLSKAQHKATPIEVRLFNAAKTRATAKGREFSIEVTDIHIPALCPVFKTPMVSPSVDRIDSSKGYIKGNASVEEMKLVLADLIRLRTGVCEIL
jgi:hypothetical protein